MMDWLPEASSEPRLFKLLQTKLATQPCPEIAQARTRNAVLAQHPEQRQGPRTLFAWGSAIGGSSTSARRRPRDSGLRGCRQAQGLGVLGFEVSGFMALEVEGRGSGSLASGLAE